MEATEIKDNAQQFGQHRFGQTFLPNDLHIKAACLFNERINAAIVKTSKELLESCPINSDLNLNSCLIKALSLVFIGFENPMQALFVAKIFLENTPKDMPDKKF